jgi:hypothetical protein
VLSEIVYRSQEKIATSHVSSFLISSKGIYLLNQRNHRLALIIQHNLTDILSFLEITTNTVPPAQESPQRNYPALVQEKRRLEFLNLE